MTISRPNPNTFLINGKEVEYIMLKNGEKIFPDQLGMGLSITDFDDGNGNKNVVKGSVIKAGSFRLGDD